MMQPNTCILEKRQGGSADHSVVLMNPQQMKSLDLYDDDVVLVKAKRNRDVVAVVKSNTTLTDNNIQMTDVLRANIRYVIYIY
jgi:formylmethanofuran dehydrogenase subunit D